MSLIKPFLLENSTTGSIGTASNQTFNTFPPLSLLWLSAMAAQTQFRPYQMFYEQVWPGGEEEHFSGAIIIVTMVSQHTSIGSSGTDNVVSTPIDPLGIYTPTTIRDLFSHNRITPFHSLFQRPIIKPKNPYNSNLPIPRQIFPHTSLTQLLCI